MKKLTAVAGGGFAAGFIVAVVLMGRPEPKAATSLVGFLLLMLIILGTVGAGLAMVPEWWKKHKQRAQLDEAERMGRVHSALNGERSRPAARRPAQGNDGGPTIYVVGGERSESQVREDLVRWLGIGQ